MRLAFRVSYIGTRFFGSQVQADRRTVEGEFIAACRRLDLFMDFRQAGFLSAGRTDRGVHARGQVISFSTNYPERAITALNAQLPPDCWCTGYAEVPDEFHPRYDARSRTYRYYFAATMADKGEVARAAQLFTGTHNFANFARVRGKNPFRTVHAASIGEERGFVWLEVTADSFLWHQVRCMAAALWQVGAGEIDGGSITALLEQESAKAVPPAPAEGLILWETDCGITFIPMTVDGRSAAYLEYLRRHHALMEQVCRTLAAREEAGHGDECD
ncbi:MAG: tRNA pseudouridine(38-40) synthase TruA [Methanoregula sp.]|nr:MAG: tRNA pseudouridine(38-40) synthase TruA [Methanoregula sp.]